MELSRLQATRYHKISHNPIAIKRLFVDLFLEAHERPPSTIVLDLDATDDPVHGEQEGQFFHGYYDCYCYLPLYVFCGHHLLAAKLRSAGVDAADGAVEEVARIVKEIRRRWPKVRIVLRADSGFARDELMAWRETHGVEFVFGLQQNERLIEELKCEFARAKAKSRRTGKPVRYLKEFKYRTRRSWSRERRVVGKAEVTQGEANPRFVVTSLKRAECGPKYLYEKLYCARGDMENRIKECQLDLYADRTSTAAAGKSAVRVVRLHGLCAALRLAPDWAAQYAVCQGQLRNDPPQAPQNRRAHPHQRSTHQDRYGVKLSRRQDLGAGCRQAQRHGKRPGLTRLTRGAAPRVNGVIPRPTGIPF
jgi:Transposase DDE domain group 1